MTFLIPDNEVLKTKIDHAREDIKKLHPLLTLLEPPDRDQITGFAEKLMGFRVRRQAITDNIIRELSGRGMRLAQNLDHHIGVDWWQKVGSVA